jgi:endo-beta-N-acetylglucosaminidase D
LQRLVDGKPGDELYYANKLVDMAEHYGFDGWFFNIECKVAPEYIFKLLEFLEYITIACHQRIENSQVLWYDSVTVHGDLKWQDSLNENNMAFFETCVFYSLKGLCINSSAYLGATEYS